MCIKSPIETIKPQYPRRPDHVEIHNDEGWKTLAKMVTKFRELKREKSTSVPGPNVKRYTKKCKRRS